MSDKYRHIDTHRVSISSSSSSSSSSVCELSHVKYVVCWAPDGKTSKRKGERTERRDKKMVAFHNVDEWQTDR